MALLMYAGNDLEDLHDTIPDVIKPENVTDDNWMNYARSKAKLSGYFSPITCNDFALFELMTLKPESHENISSYVTRLRQAATKCNFDAWSDEKMIKCVLISNMKDDTLRIKFLQKVHSLQEIVDFIRKREDATAHNKIIEEEKGSELRYSNTHRVEKDRKGKIESKEVQSDSRRYESKGRKKEYGRGKKGKDNIALRKACKYCGFKEHFGGEAPARGRECGVCKKTGHYASVCWKKKQTMAVVREVSSEEKTDSDSDGYDTSLIQVLRLDKSQTLMSIRTNGKIISWQPDTGTD